MLNRFRAITTFTVYSTRLSVTLKSPSLSMRQFCWSYRPRAVSGHFLANMCCISRGIWELERFQATAAMPQATYDFSLDFNSSYRFVFQHLPEPNRACLVGVYAVTLHPLLSLYGIIYVTWYSRLLPKATRVRFR